MFFDQAVILRKSRADCGCYRDLFSTPNMTGRRFHRAMDMLSPGSLRALLFPPLLNKVQNKGTRGASTSVVQSHWAGIFGGSQPPGEL